MFAGREPIRIDPGERPVLVVVVDTEEEFDWDKGFDPDATSVRALAGIGRFQSICDEFGLHPTYVVDYPVAAQPEGVEALREFVDSGRATVGAHLHPWVSPPLEEEPNAKNSYPGNLDPDLEARKLKVLAEAIEQGFGVRPVVYKAGRYGLGPHTPRTLEELGFEVDLSVCPRLDMSPEFGPDFSSFGPTPFWFGATRRLLEIPVTAAHVGYLRFAAPALRRILALRWTHRLRFSGILSRLRAFERLRLSPEGMGSAEHRRITRSLLGRGERIFTFSFHSPSVAPGYTAYVRDEADLGRFLDSCRRYFEFFLGEVKGTGMTPVELKRHLEARR